MNKNVRRLVFGGIKGLIIVLIAWIIVKMITAYNHNKSEYEILCSIYDNMEIVDGGKFTIGKDSIAFWNEVNLIKETTKDSIDEDYKEYYIYENSAKSEYVTTFYINKFVVTQKQWKVIMGYNPIVVGYGDNTVTSCSKKWRQRLYECLCWFMDSEKMEYTGVGDDFPINFVSWDDAKEFIIKLNKLNEEHRKTLKTEYEKAHPGKQYVHLKYKLPTEIEWEYAARGGKNWKEYDYIFSGSNSIERILFDKALFSKVTDIADIDSSKLGLYNMSGNVFEWCADEGVRDYKTDTLIYDKKKHEGKHPKDYRVLRGGSYVLNAYCSRVSYRGFALYHNFADTWDMDVSFRLAADAEKPE